MIKTTQIGRGAEAAVAKLLSKNGHKILAQNWRTKACEIDVVTKKGDIVYFVEVKYRAGAEQGGGLEHITPKKINQIKFATQIWCHGNGWDGDCRIIGAEVSGLNYDDIDLVELD